MRAFFLAVVFLLLSLAAAVDGNHRASMVRGNPDKAADKADKAAEEAPVPTATPAPSTGTSSRVGAPRGPPRTVSSN